MIVCTAVETGSNIKGATGDMTSQRGSQDYAVPNLDSLKVHEEIVSHALLDESSAFLESLRLAVTAGKRQVMGKTLLDPKKDSKWERGRTRQALHFGAHLRGSKAVGAEVEDVPPCLLEVALLLQARGLLESSRQGDQAAEVGPENRILAVTVDFFRKGSYAPALAATASFLDPSASASPKPAQPPGKAKSTSAEGDKSSGNTTLRGGDSDTEPVVCMLWLQRGGEVVVGSAQQLAKCSNGPKGAGTKGTQSNRPAGAAEEKPGGTGAGVGEGTFSGVERTSTSKGSVMVWNSAQALKGLQVAVPSALRDRVLVTFQTLTPEASTRAVENRRRREEARAKAAMIRRIDRSTTRRHALCLVSIHQQGPIPGTPIVVADWKEQEHGDGDQNSARPGTGSSGCDHKQSSEDDGKTPSIEAEHVQAVYDTIATHWSHTRYKPWTKVEKFLCELEACSLVADAGCGNGKYLGCKAAGGFLLGSDASVNLLHVCRERLPEAEVLASDCMRLPYRSGVFDAAISIAVLHHFSSEARRLRALSELCRLLRPGGRVLVYAWAIEQEQDSRRSFAAQDVLVPWHLADHHNQSQGRSKDDVDASSVIATDGSSGIGDDTIINNSGPEEDETPNAESSGAAPAERADEVIGVGHGSGNVERGEAESVSAPTPNAPRHGVRVDAVAGTGGSVVYQRYCHVYAEGELEGLVERVDGLRLVESYYDRSNWCVVAERDI
ncbi:unnamed protein product [Pylaiella littoralis]